MIQILRPKTEKYGEFIIESMREEQMEILKLKNRVPHVYNLTVIFTEDKTAKMIKWKVSKNRSNLRQRGLKQGKPRNDPLTS